MRRAFWVLVWACGCATSTSVHRAPRQSCSLDDETACVAYGATLDGAPPTPAGQLAMGLAARAQGLPPEEAVDYWRRIAEIVDASDQSDEAVNRSAAPAYAELAALEVRLSADPDDDDAIDDIAADGQQMLRDVRRLAEFALKWGDRATQARAARAIADAYARQATVLAHVSLPPQLTTAGQASFEAKRDALVAELTAESERLRAGVDEYCRKHGLHDGGCPAARRRAQPNARGGVCGVRVGMSSRELTTLHGDPDEVSDADAAGCETRVYGGLRVTLCFDVVRDVRRDSLESCP